jgi:hypothetical protein
MTTTPYRDQNLACPGCNQTLRPFRTRFVCDSCLGMFVTLPDLTEALTELTGQTPTLELIDDKGGARHCPRCPATLKRCHLRVVFGEEVAKPRPELDRCNEHGIWFDKDEMAAVFEKAYAKVGHQGGGPGRGIGGGSSGNGGWKGGSGGVPEWWGGGHGNY